MHGRAERFYLKLLLGSVIGIILLIAAIWGGHDGYVRWQERRLVRRAVFAIEQGDARTASLAARNVLELKPSSAAAARIMAQLAENSGDRVAVDWRRKVVELEPKSTEDALAWARCALQFNDVGTAERALARINEAGRQTAGYHAVAALLAQAQQQGEKADGEWAEAVRLAPDEKAYQLQLAVLRAHAPNADRHGWGEAMLKALRDDPKQRAAATRALISDGVMRHEAAPQLLELAGELQNYPEATLRDRLLFLDLLHQLQDAHFTSYLTELEKSAATRPLDLTELLSWMSQNNLNVFAIDFIQTLSRETLEKWPVPVVVADIYVRLTDWRKLENVTKTANWRQFDFLRHAYLARALRAEDKPAAAEREWDSAQKEASSRAEYLSMLARAASDWGWQRETLELLWLLTKHPEKQLEALQELYQKYADARDTPGLYRVLVQLGEVEPSDLRIQNNLAQISLLLNADVDRARRLAAELYRKEGSNPAYASTYAFALYRKGDTNGALKVMNGLSDSQLRDPSVAAYYSVILAEAGDMARAREYLKLSAPAKLLPEEKELVVKAEETVK